MKTCLSYSPQNIQTPEISKDSSDENLNEILYGHDSEIVNILKNETDQIDVSYSYRGCCWFNLQPDNEIKQAIPVADNSNDSTENHQLSGNFADRDLNFKMKGTIRNPTSPSPRMIIPSQWFLNPGCDSSLQLYPFISNKNSIKCRWATYQEALGGAYDPNVWPSISLTEDCLLTYNASKELIQAYLKIHARG